MHIYINHLYTYIWIYKLYIYICILVHSYINVNIYTCIHMYFNILKGYRPPGISEHVAPHDLRYIIINYMLVYMIHILYIHSYAYVYKYIYIHILYIYEYILYYKYVSIYNILLSYLANPTGD
jgi:hypothetical protein